MKKGNLIELIKMSSIVIPKLFIKQYKELGLTSEEFIFICYLLSSKEKITLDAPKIATEMSLDTKEVLSLVQSLKEKDMIAVLVHKDNKRVVNEYIELAPFYNKLVGIYIEYLNNSKSNKETNYLFEAFEKEFGRTLSPMEYEIINAWLEANIGHELILEALKEATYNGVSNLRYIDKIIYEWTKKGFKTPMDVKKAINLHREQKKQVEVFNYNWLEDEEHE